MVYLTKLQLHIRFLQPQALILLEGLWELYIQVKLFGKFRFSWQLGPSMIFWLDGTQNSISDIS